MRPLGASDFYFPHIKYGKLLVSPPENKNFFFAFFHVLGLIIPKKSDAPRGRIETFLIST
jgi:hypothetical protein